MSFEIKYRLRFEGDEADRSRLPAHEGAASIEGMTWSLSLMANYLATGEIRHRGQMTSNIRLYLSPARQGSFIDDVVLFVTQPNNLWLTTIVGTYAVGTLAQIINTAIVYTVKEVCGLPSRLNTSETRWMSKLPSGDVEHLVDRIEPSMRRAHSVIADGATSMTLLKSQTPVVLLNHQTKAYVNSSIIDDRDIERTVSVGAFNANSGNGRMYMPEIGKTVPFSMEREVVSGTYQVLSASLDRYVRGVNSEIKVISREVLASDGRIKKLLITSAWKHLP